MTGGIFYLDERTIINTTPTDIAAGRAFIPGHIAKQLTPAVISIYKNKPIWAGPFSFNVWSQLDLNGEPSANATLTTTIDNVDVGWLKFDAVAMDGNGNVIGVDYLFETKDVTYKIAFETNVVRITTVA